MATTTSSPTTMATTTTEELAPLPVFYEYVFGRAREDNALNSEECRTFEEAHQIQTTSVVRETGSSPAAIVGRRLAELGEMFLYVIS